MAEHVGIAKSAVQHRFDLFGVQPHCQRHFKPSNGPFCIEKPRDIVGPYLNPPDYAVGLCMDEKSQINAVVERYNANASPSALVATAESIVGKIDFAH